MRPKGECELCGITHPMHTLKKEIRGSKLLCGRCYKYRNNERYDEQLALLPKINGVSNVIINKKKKSRHSGYYGARGMGITGDEYKFLQGKYGYDSFSNRINPLKKIRELKQTLFMSSNKIRKNERDLNISNNIIKQNKKKMNNNFLEGLKAV